MFAIIAALTVSCSKSYGIMDEEIPFTRADSPLLVVSPTEVVFNEGGSRTQEIEIKTAGISSLAVLTRFNLTIQGPDADKFSVEQVPASLAEILMALLGDGIRIFVDYNATTAGEHNAELLIDAALLGAILPVQTTIPLKGTTNDGVPQVVSTMPVSGDQNVQASNFYFRITYDQNINVVDQNLITVNGSQIDGIPNGKALEIPYINGPYPFLLSNNVYNVVIKAGAVSGLNGQLTTEDYTLTFKTTDNTPKLVSVDPPSGSTIYYYSDEVEEKQIKFKYDRPVTYNAYVLNGIEGFPIPIYNIGNSNDSTIVVTISSIYALTPLGIVIKERGILDLNSNQSLERVAVAYATARGSN